MIEPLHHRLEGILLGEEGLFVGTNNRWFAHTTLVSTPSRTRSTAWPFNSHRSASWATSGSGGGASSGQRLRSFTASVSVTAAAAACFAARARRATPTGGHA